jgi:catechol 2,3-dioxygenase-like lactoylglutathione lyase family enzyme
MPFARISSITVPVSDVERALELYRDVLGFTVFRDLLRDTPARTIHLTAPAGGSVIILVPGTVDAPVGSLRGATLQVSNMGDALGRLLWANITPVWGDADAPGGPAAQFADPDGNVWTLWQPAAQLAAVAA